MVSGRFPTAAAAAGQVNGHWEDSVEQWREWSAAEHIQLGGTEIDGLNDWRDEVW